MEREWSQMKDADNSITNMLFYLNFDHQFPKYFVHIDQLTIGQDNLYIAVYQLILISYQLPLL